MTPRLIAALPMAALIWTSAHATPSACLDDVHARQTQFARSHGQVLDREEAALNHRLSPAERQKLNRLRTALQERALKRHELRGEWQAALTRRESKQARDYMHELNLMDERDREDTRAAQEIFVNAVQRGGPATVENERVVLRLPLYQDEHGDRQVLMRQVDPVGRSREFVEIVHYGQRRTVELHEFLILRSVECAADKAATEVRRKYGELTATFIRTTPKGTGFPAPAATGGGRMPASL